MGTVKAENLVDELGRILNAYKFEIADGINADIEEVAKETQKELKKTSPKNLGNYAKSWAVEVHGSINSKMVTATIYVKSPHYRLTHLLENGHALHQGGRVAPHEHIGPAEERAVKKLLERVQKTIENA